MDVLNKTLDAMNSYGPSAVVFIGLLLSNGVLLWHVLRREDKCQKRVEKLEAKFDSTLLPIVAEYQVVIGRATECIEQNSRVIEKLIDGRR